MMKTINEIMKTLNSQLDVNFKQKLASLLTELNFCLNNLTVQMHGLYAATLIIMCINYLLNYVYSL